MSLNPWVVTKAVRAVLPSIIAFVATVVACTTCSMCEGSTEADDKSFFTAEMKPDAGLDGVDRTLDVVTRPVVESTSVPSVKVPPISTPIRYLLS